MMVKDLEIPVWLEPLNQIFKDEIDSYENLLSIEREKRQSILKADSKRIESLSNESVIYIRKAQYEEKKRMELLEKIYLEENREVSKENLTLTEFLNVCDRQLNFVLKDNSTKLKTTVHALKEAIIINEKLLQTRNRLIQETIMGMKQLREESDSTYNSDLSTKSQSNNRSSLFLNTKA